MEKKKNLRTLFAKNFYRIYRNTLFKEIPPLPPTLLPNEKRLVDCDVTTTMNSVNNAWGSEILTILFIREVHRRTCIEGDLLWTFYCVYLFHFIVSFWFLISVWKGLASRKSDLVRRCVVLFPLCCEGNKMYFHAALFVYGVWGK